MTIGAQGDGPALYFDHTFKHCTTNRSLTFSNEPLNINNHNVEQHKASSPQLEIEDIEVFII